MSTDLRALHDELKRDWCDSFNVEVATEHQLIVSTPFVYGDGDGYPVMIERARNGWRITDHGLAISHLQAAEHELTDLRLRQIGHFATSFGCEYRGSEMSAYFDDVPDVDDIVGFVKVLTLIEGLPLHVAPERDSDRFQARMSRAVISWLPKGVEYDTDWKPAQARAGSRRFSPDLWLPSPKQPVVTFFVGNGQRAERCINAIHQYNEWDVNVKSLIAHNNTLNSEQRYAAVLALRDESALVTVREEGKQTAFIGLRSRLVAEGVPLASE